MVNSLNILFLENTSTDNGLIRSELKRQNIDFHEKTVNSSREFEDSILSFSPDIIISDYNMPHLTGIEALHIAKKADPDIPFIVVTGSNSEEIAVECMKAGADDYILRDNIPRIGPAIIYALNKIDRVREKKNAEVAYNLTTEKLKSIFRVVPVGIGLTKNRVLIEVNPFLSEMTGYSDEELIGSSARILYVDQGDFDIVGREKYKQIYETGSGTVETRWRKKDGKIINIILSSTYLYPKDPELGVIFTALDITRIKNAEKDLLESELRLHKAQSIAHVGNWELDLSTKKVTASDEALRIYGYDGDSDTLTLDVITSFPLPEYRQLLDEALERLIKFNEPYDIEFKIKRSNDGAIRSIYSKAELVQSNSKEQMKVIGVLQDITDREKTAEDLRESEKKYRRIFENVQDPYYESSLDGEILEISPSIRLLSHGQYSQDDLMGKSIYEFYADPLKRKLLLDALRDKGSVSDFEITLKNRDGSLIPCSISAKISVDKMNSPEKIIGSMRDITDRKKAEESLIMAKEKAEESDRLKTAFIHNISHEIRTPMNAIIGFSTLLCEPDLTEEDKSSFIDVLMNSSNHLLSIVNDILEIANIEAGIVSIKLTGVNIKSLVKNLYVQFKPVADKKGVELKYVIDNKIDDPVIKTDNTKLIQVFNNLLNNAFKFTSKGEVKFGYTLKDDFIEFFVKDTGIGIHEEMLTRVFDRFFQVESSMEKSYEGMGLGLSISKSFIELLGGQMTVQSKYGNGSSFYFTLPFEATHILPEENHEVEMPGKRLIEKEKKTILIAEDEYTNYRLMVEFLSPLSVEVLHAENGREAVNICKSNKDIDIVLMDIKMPVMDGYMATAEIKKIFPDLPVIAVTAYAFESDGERAIKAGCNEYLSKPVRSAVLLETVNRYLKSPG